MQTVQFSVIHENYCSKTRKLILTNPHIYMLQSIRQELSTARFCLA